MTKIFNITIVKSEIENIKTFINDVIVTLKTGNINRILLIDTHIHKSLREIKRQYSYLTFNISQIQTLTISHEQMLHIRDIFDTYFNIIDVNLDITNSNLDIEVKNRDIIQYCESALQQINKYIDTFHYERMKFSCSY